MHDNVAARPVYRDAVRATCLGLGVNLALGIGKLVGGLAGDSFALISDAVNSLGDVFASLVVLFGLWIAQRPADPEHPYGHTRAESIAGSNVALLVVLSALALGWEALRRFDRPHELPPAWTLALAAGNVLIKEVLYRWQAHVGRRTGSTAVVAGAWDHRSDALCSLAVLVGLGVVRWGGPAWIAADEVAALVVAAVVVGSGIRLFRRSLSEMMDVQADDDLVAAIRTAAAAVPDVRAVEKLWVRKSGLEFLADIHVQVDAALPVATGHRIGHRVKDHLLERFPTLRHVLVHLEPYPHVHVQ